MSTGETLPPEYTMLTRFRGEFAEAVIVNSAAELRGQADLLRDGLKELEAELALPEDMIEYSGFGLIYFPEPTEEFDFTNPEAAKALTEAFRAAGLDIPDDPGKMDDYVMRPGFCVDIMSKTSGYWSTGSLIRAAFLLAPVVRGVGWGHDRDEFRQDPKMHVRHVSALRVPGIVLLEGLIQQNPDLSEDRIPATEIAAYVDIITGIER